MPNIFEIPNWVCPACSYRQDFDPNDPSIMHTPGMYPEVPLGLCPACFTGRNAAMQRESVALEVESDRKTIITVKTAEEVSEALVQYRDQESSEIVTRPQTDAELEKRLDNLELITNQAAQLQDSEL